MFLSVATFAQDLDDVTNIGNTTTHGIKIQNANGLNIGVDASAGYSAFSHFLRPSPVASRILRFDCESILGSGGWEFFNSHMQKTLMYIMQDGRTGIGTSNPASQLHLSSDENHALTLSRTNGTYGFRIFRDAYSGTVQFQIGATEAPQWETKIQIGEGVGANTPLIINPDGGNVGIGTLSPAAKLSVNGGIIAHKVKVSLDINNWPDFVFAPGYRLPPLAHVEAFVKTNKHLPNIPSAADVQTQGLDLGDNQAKLLQKIEELTLYLIDQHKTIQAQQQQLLEMEKRLKSLERTGN
ncbi:hypothetical protein [Chitinophaga sp.]|uniref:hypothetical protein n=1 Tax=Chitinophaga sp. TaxID=1869181 RepID=UPI0031DB6FA2